MVLSVVETGELMINDTHPLFYVITIKMVPSIALIMIRDIVIRPIMKTVQVLGH